MDDCKQPMNANYIQKVEDANSWNKSMIFGLTLLYWSLCTRVYKSDRDEVSIQVFTIVILKVGR